MYLGYGGPKPPKGTGAHRYYFKLYALSHEKLHGHSAAEIEKEIKGCQLGEAVLMGTYENK